MPPLFPARGDASGAGGAGSSAPPRHDAPEGAHEGLDAAPEVVEAQAIGRRLVPVGRTTTERAVKADDQRGALHLVRCAGGEGAVEPAARTHEGGAFLIALGLVSGHLGEKRGAVSTHEPPP